MIRGLAAGQGDGMTRRPLWAPSARLVGASLPAVARLR